jgi:hypothetical protein
MKKMSLFFTRTVSGKSRHALPLAERVSGTAWSGLSRTSGIAVQKDAMITTTGLFATAPLTRTKA